MQTSKGSTFSRAKTHVVYLRYGEHVGSQANQEMQRLLSSASCNTPSVAACGATTVWANGPIAPPRHRPPLNRRRRDALKGSIGSLDMATLCIGSLTDKMV